MTNEIRNAGCQIQEKNVFSASARGGDGGKGERKGSKPATVLIRSSLLLRRGKVYQAALRVRRRSDPQDGGYTYSSCVYVCVNPYVCRLLATYIYIYRQLIFIDILPIHIIHN